MKNGTNDNENSYLKLLKNSFGEEPLVEFNKEIESNIAYNGTNYDAGVILRSRNTKGITSTIERNIIPARTISSSGTIASINGLPMEWILARERLVKNADILNNGWKVNWASGYDAQSDRAYIYASSYSSETDKFLISCTYAVWKQSADDALYFKNIKLAQKFINENEEDLQIYFSL